MSRLRHPLAALLIALAATAFSSPVRGEEEDARHRGAVAEWVREHRAAIVAELQEFLSVPNPSGPNEDIVRNADLLQRMFEKRGMQVSRISSGGGPYLLARLAPEAPADVQRTVLFYSHFDGQATDPARWTSPPFEPRLTGPVDDDDTRVYARSASDDKGPIIALLAAVDALRAVGIPPNIEALFILDPEEETGSPHLEEAIEPNAARMAADMMIFADGPLHPSGKPTVVFGTRGIVTVSLTLYGPALPLHSGHYGNWARNPAEKLAALLASMKDGDGVATVEGFYDDVVPLTDSERQAIARIPDIEAKLRHDLTTPLPDGGGRSLQELINRPSLNVRGMASAWVGDAARTVVPDTATAEIDMRLVKNIDPLRQVARLRKHIEKQGYHVVEDEPDLDLRRRHPRLVRLTHGTGTPAVRTPMDTPLSLALVNAVRRAVEGEPVLIPTLGGTVPLSRYEAILGLPIYGVPMVQPDNNQHSPDENLRLGNLWEGIVIYASLLRLGSD